SKNVLICITPLKEAGKTKSQEPRNIRLTTVRQSACSVAFGVTKSSESDCGMCPRMQAPSDSSVALDSQVRSATVALPLKTSPFSLLTINKAETNNKVVISQNLLFIRCSFTSFGDVVKTR